MNIIVEDDNGKKSIIEGVIVFDCFTKNDILQQLDANAKEKQIEEICKIVAKQCSKLDYYPSCDEFSEIVKDSISKHQDECRV